MNFVNLIITTSCAVCSAAATICPRPLQVVTNSHHSGLVTLTFDLLTLELMRNVTRGTDNLHANFGVSVTSLSIYGQTRIRLTT